MVVVVLVVTLEVVALVVEFIEVRGCSHIMSVTEGGSANF